MIVGNIKNEYIQIVFNGPHAGRAPPFLTAATLPLKPC